MKHFKRILVLFISAALFVGSLCAYAKPDSEGASASQIDKLHALGIWVPDVNSDAVTRGEFARLIMAMLGMNELEYEVSSRNAFSDVDSENAAYTAIHFLVQQGVLTGEGGMFYPAREITYAEAVKMLVCALGYEPAAMEKGGYPNGYLTAAVQFDLIKNSGKNPDDSLSAEACAEMIGYALDAKLMEPNYGTDGGWSIKDTTCMREYHKIEKVTGVLESAGGLSLEADADYPDDTLIIGENRFCGAARDFEKYVGYRVEAYYKLAAGQAESNIIYMEPSESANRILEISEDEILDCIDGYLVYENASGGIQRRLVISEHIKVLFNGVRGDITEDDIKDANKIVFIDNGIDAMPVVKIESFHIYVADNFDHVEHVLTDRFAETSERRIALGENDGVQKVSIVNHLGTPTDFYAVKKNSVLRVGKSKNEKRISIILTSVQKDGVLEGFNLTEKTLMLGGAEYPVAPKSAAERQLEKAEAGKQYSLYLDDRFYVAAMERVNASEEKYGYMTGAVCSDAFQSAVSFRIYTQNDKFEVFSSAKRIRVDGDMMKNGADVIAALQNEQGKIERQPIRYHVNEEGQLDYLDTARLGPNEQSNGTFRGNSTMTKYAPFIGGRFIGDPPMFGAESYSKEDNMQYNLKMTAKTPVFCVPPLNATDEQIRDEDNYCVANIRIFKNFDTYKENAATGERVDAYDLDDDWVAGMLLYYTRKTTAEPITDKTPVTVVEGIVQGLDGEGSPQSCLTGFQAGNFISVPIRDGFEDLTKEYQAEDGTVTSTVRFGDVIRFSLDSKGRIDDYEKVFSLTDEDDPEYIKWGNEVNSVNTAQNNPSLVAWSEGYTDHGFSTPFVYKKNEVFEAGYRVVFGTLKERVGNNIVLQVSGEKPMTIVGDIQRYNVVVVDEGRHEMYMPDLNEFMPESVVGAEAASQVLMHTSKGSSRTVVLVKRAVKK